MATLTELSVIAGQRYRSATAERLCYLTDGLSNPKMYDGADLVNWGVYAPSTGPSAAASSTGATQIDTCEALWTPVSSVMSSGESAWTLSGGLSSSASALCLASSSYYKIGSASALTLIGTSVEPIDSHTKLMVHCNGADGSTTFTDSSESGHALTATGAAQKSTSDKVFGTAGLKCAAGDQITIPASSDLAMGTDDFTIDFWVKYDSSVGSDYTDRVLRLGASGDFLAIDLYHSDQTDYIQLSNANGLLLRGYTTITKDVDFHVAVCRSGTTAYIFKDGELLASGEVATDFDAASSGASYFGSVFEPLYMDEIRIDKGVARWTDIFIVPDTEYGEFVDLTNDPEDITGIVSYDDLGSALDMSTYWGIEFWVRSSKTLSAGDISLVLCDSTGGNDEVERCDMPALTPGNWAKVRYKLQTPSDLTSVASVALAVNRDRGKNAIYIDDVKAVRCKVTLDRDTRQEGNSSVRLEIPGGVPASTLVAYKALSSTDFSSDTEVLMHFRSNKYLGYQMLQYVLDDTAACASPLEELYITADLAADTWHQLSLTLANPGSDTAIISEGIKVSNASVAPLTLWIDDIRRATSASGNLTGRYYAWVSFYSSKYDRESDLSPISNVVDCQGQAVALTSIPTSDDSQVDMRRVYRSQAGGTVPYLDQTIEDNTTTVATLTRTDASLGLKRRHPSGEAGSGNYAPPYASPYITMHKNTIITGGSIAYDLGTVDVTNDSETVTMNSPGEVNASMIGKEFRIEDDNQIYIIEDVNTTAGTFDIRPIDDLVSGTYKGTTDTGVSYQIIGDENALHTSYIDDDNVPRYHAFPADLVQTLLDGRAGDKITGLGTLADAFIVTKQSSTHICEGNYAPWSTNKISDSIGCSSHDTIVQDEKGQALWLAGEGGVAGCDGYSVKLISDVLLDLFDGTHDLGFNTEKYGQAHAVYDIKKHWYWLFLTSKNSEENDICLVLDRSKPSPERWNWYYFTGVYAASSCIYYDANQIAHIYIGDYDGFVSELNVGYYDGVQSGTLSGTPTSGSSTALWDTEGAFYETGDGLKAMYIAKYTPSTGVWEHKKIASNTATRINIDGSWDNAPTTSDEYYIGSYELDWKSKNFQFARATDKNMLHDLVLNHQEATASQNLRVRVSKNLGKTTVANQEIDIGDGEEAILLIRQRLQQAQIRVNGYSQGQAIEVNALGMRFAKKGIR